MTNIAQIKRPQVISEDILEEAEEIIKQAREGKIVDFVLVANHAEDEAYIRISQFQDGWRALGALEYAKDTILRGFGSR